MQIIQTQKVEETIMKSGTVNSTSWPFAIVNNQRTPESQKLLDTKRFPKEKPDTSDWEESPF